MAGYNPIDKLYTVQQHRLADYFEKQQIFYPFSTWPAWLQDVALKCPKNFSERTGMFFHLARNNLFPGTCRQWVLAGDVVDGKVIWSEEYPVDVRMDMARLVKKALAGEILDPQASNYSHQLGVVVKGLNPDSQPRRGWPAPADDSARARRRSLSRTKTNTGTTRPVAPKKVPGVYYPPTQPGPYRRLTSSIKWFPSGKFYVTTYGGRAYRLNKNYD